MFELLVPTHAALDTDAKERTRHTAAKNLLAKYIPENRQKPPISGIISVNL
jgi:hypothetical protein